MSGVYVTLTDFALWPLFLLGIVNIVAPTIMGIVTQSLAGSIHSVEDGKLWFYRHGLAYLIGAAALVAFFYGASLGGSRLCTPLRSSRRSQPQDCAPFAPETVRQVPPPVAEDLRRSWSTAWSADRTRSCRWPLATLSPPCEGRRRFERFDAEVM